MVIVTLAACSSGESDEKDVRNNFTPTAPVVPWQRPEVPISQTTPFVHLTGVMRLHQSTVNDVAFAANGIRMASVGADGITAVWNLANGTSLFEQDRSDGQWVYFGPDDETLITVSQEGFTRVWLMNMRVPRQLEEVITFAGYDESVWSVDQSPDRTLLAYGAENGGIRLWNVLEGRLVADINAHLNSVEMIAFAPDGTLLASVGADRTVKAWSVPDGALRYGLVNVGGEEEDYRIPVTLTFSADSARLAVAFADSLEVWDLATDASVFTVGTTEHAATHHLVFSPDGSLLVGCGRQPRIEIWNAVSGEFLAGLPTSGQACGNAIFSPDGMLLLTVPIPGRDVFLWNLAPIIDGTLSDVNVINRANRQSMGIYPGPQFFDAEWAPDGRFIVLQDELGPMYMLSAQE
jgi:WD40 repeat protein